MDMGLEPYLVASAVAGIVAQRLVRRLCPDCRKVVEPKMKFLNEIGFPVDQLVSGKIYETGKCENCRMTGFRGRSGIFEILPVTDNIQSLIIGRRPASEVKHEALKGGMRTLRDDGWEKVLRGVTTIEEVLRATEENQ
jgi:type II secretory ATPase GspE/PulE/Tfp pilus assembly ATPase PilB-like protein